NHELAYVADVSEDPDYVAIHDRVVSEICAPLLIEGTFLGVLNVEAVSPLDRTDRDLVATLADRVATVVALGRDRQALSERAALRSEEHTSELQSLAYLVCRLLLEKKNNKK